MIKKKNAFSGTKSPASAMHRKVVELLREAYPAFTILENEPIDVPAGPRTTTLFVDVVVKDLSLAIECHGRQHFEHVKHFHATLSDFKAAVDRDRAKAEQIAEAGYTYLMIRFDEYEDLTVNKLLKKIVKAIKEQTK